MTHQTGLHRFVVLAAALALSGCSLGGAAGSSSSGGGSAGSGGQRAVATQSGTAGFTTSTEARRPLVAERTYVDEQGNTIAYAPVALRREGDLVVLELGIRNITPANTGDAKIGLYNLFRSSISSVFDTATLVDVQNRKSHVVVRDSKGDCLCSQPPDLPRGANTVLTAYYAAPPAGVTTMDVLLLRRGSFPSVPLG